MYDDYNPIRRVNGRSIKSPSSFQWKLEDISASDAGRTEDTVMCKNRIGQCVKIELEWKNVTIGEASEILTAFNPEYITVEYLDAKEGRFVTSEFYVGGRSAPLYNATKGLWSNIAFSIIERSGV